MIEENGSYQPNFLTFELDSKKNKLLMIFMLFLLFLFVVTALFEKYKP